MQRVCHEADLPVQELDHKGAKILRSRTYKTHTVLKPEPSDSLCIQTAAAGQGVIEEHE